MQPSCSRLQVRTEGFALVEHEAVASVMRAADLFEILEDAAFQLVDAMPIVFMWMAAFSQRMPST